MNSQNCENKRIFQSVLCSLVAIMLTLCFGFAFVSCCSDISYKDAVKLAKKDYGCKSILWVGHVGGIGQNPLRGDADLPPDGGRIVVGLDKNGNEVYVLFPNYISTNYKPSKREWPFSYSMQQIISFAGQYGYKYADGIDGRIDEYFADSFDHRLYAYDTDPQIKEFTFGNVYFESLGGTLYDSLDLKLVFSFSNRMEEVRYDYAIVQINGELVIVEAQSGHWGDAVLHKYNKDNATD